KAKVPLEDAKKKELFKGVLTRPLRNLAMDVFLPAHRQVGSAGPRLFRKDPDLHCELMIPDLSRLIFVPITRSPFIKKNQVPKFTSGLLVENYINKPSEAEGFLSIPINVAKAIFAIP